MAEKKKIAPKPDAAPPKPKPKRLHPIAAHNLTNRPRSRKR